MATEFVEPEAERLHLSGADRWVDVKRELNAGETDDMNAEVIKELKSGEKPELDATKVHLYKLCAYIVGWSFKDAKGQPVDVSPSAIRALRTTTRDEIAKLLDAHIEQSENAITERKNAQADTRELSRISPSAA